MEIKIELNGNKVFVTASIISNDLGNKLMQTVFLQSLIFTYGLHPTLETHPNLQD